MTTDEFYVALEKKTKRSKVRWGTGFLGMLRTTARCDCPLSFVAGTPADAADDYGPERHRSRLLRACGLES